MKREINIEFFNKNYYQLNVGIKSKEEQDRKINMMIDQYLLENPNYNPSNIMPYSDETETGDTAFDEEYEIEYTFIKNRWLPVYKSEEKKNKFFRAKLESLFRESDDSVFRKYELKFTRENFQEIQVEIKTPVELKGLSFHIDKENDLTEFISKEVKDPFKYIKSDVFNNLDPKTINNIIIKIAHIDYLNEQFKRNKLIHEKKYNMIEKKIKRWFLDIENFSKTFECEINLLNHISKIPNKKDERRAQELIMLFNQMQNTAFYYKDIKKNYFEKNNRHILNKNYIKLLKKTIFSIKVDNQNYRIKPINLDDRIAEFEIISPDKYKGLYITLRHIPIIVLAYTNTETYFDSGRLTQYGKSELELLIREKKFSESLIYSNVLGSKINKLSNEKSVSVFNKSSDFDNFKELYKKVFMSNSNIKIENPSKKQEASLFIINEFYNKYADLVSREYLNILNESSKSFFSTSYNLPNKKVYNMNELSANSTRDLLYEFRYFFINRLVKKYSPLNSLPKPKGAMIIGNHKINIK